MPEKYEEFAEDFAEAFNAVTPKKDIKAYPKKKIAPKKPQHVIRKDKLLKNTANPNPRA